MPYSHRLKVRYVETDQMGVVHHSSHLSYLEEARTEYMASLGMPYGAMEAAGVALPVRRVEVRYRAPALYEDELEVQVAISGLRAASIRFQYTVLRPKDGITLLDGLVELACMDIQTRAPMILPEKLRAGLESELS